MEFVALNPDVLLALTANSPKTAARSLACALLDDALWCRTERSILTHSPIRISLRDALRISY